LISILRRKRFWATVLGLGFLVWCLYDLDVSQVGLIVKNLRYPYLLWAMAVVVGILYVRSTRWRILVHPIKDIPAGRMFSIYAVGQLGNLLFPAGTGTALRVILLHRKEGVSKTGGASTVMLETLMDALSLALFMVGAASALVLPGWLQRGKVWGAVLITAILVVLILMVQLRHVVSRYVERLEQRLSEKWYNRVHTLWTNFQEGISSLRSLKHMTLAFFTSVASWLGQLAVISLLLYAFGFALPPGAALVLMVVNTMLMAVPVTPGNVGTYQVATVFGLSLFGVDKTDAVSYGIVLQAATFVPIAIVGLYQYFRHSWSLKVPEEDSAGEAVKPEQVPL
jgi:uncharacterized protein (TIRG00374 family)